MKLKPAIYATLMLPAIPLILAAGIYAIERWGHYLFYAAIVFLLGIAWFTAYKLFEEPGAKDG